MAGIYKLTGTVKHYDWGGISFIPSLLKKVNEKKIPYAEYWMGTHSLGQSLIDTGGSIPTELNAIANSLPYLLKVLDVKDMLSIQVHPSQEAAAIEFAREEGTGIPLDAPERSYKDANHKPELMVALSDFWLLHGFKPTDKLIDTLSNVIEFKSLLPVFTASGYDGLYKHIMEMPQEEVDQLLQPLIDRIVPLYNANELEKNNVDFWAARAAIHFSNEQKNIDRGIFSIYFFNLVRLKKGEAIFQAAGVPHAYLEGQNVEIMANSDNVLRGGLTTKHIDVAELMKHVKCEATIPQIITGDLNEEGERTFNTPVPDFTLSVFDMEKGDVASFNPNTTEIVLLTEGIVEADDDDTTIRLQPGTPSAVVFPGSTVYLAAAAKSVVFRASAAQLH
ncbi:MAG: mannose-6-phosphate isomerase, class I [Chitinophagaceae bacterium]